MSSVLKISEKKVGILHSGIDVGYINSIKQPDNDGSIVYIGRLVPQKNVDLLIRSYARLQKGAQKYHHLKIIGEGSERPKLEALAKSLGVEVNFTGTRLDGADITQANISYANFCRTQMNGIKNLKATIGLYTASFTEVEAYDKDKITILKANKRKQLFKDEKLGWFTRTFGLY